MNPDPKLDLDDTIFEGPESFIEEDDETLEEDALLEELDLEDMDDN